MPIRSTSCTGSSAAGQSRSPLPKFAVILGVETQRQWTDPAIARTTPVLLALFSLVVLWVNNLQRERPCEVAEHCWDPARHAIIRYGDLFKGLNQAEQSEV